MSIMSDDRLINNEVIRIFQEKVVLTEEELLHTFTAEELKLLCEKYKCKVDMWKWNPVDDMREKLEKDGRFKHRTTNYCLRLIAKGVNKHKHRIAYNRKDIMEIREEDWNVQKRACIRFINEYKKKNDQQKKFVKYGNVNGNVNGNRNDNDMVEQCHYISSNSSVEADGNGNSQKEPGNDNKSQEMIEEHLFDSVSDYTMGDTEVLLQTNEKIQDEQQKQIESDIQHTIISSSNPNVISQLNTQDNQHEDINFEICQNLNYNTQSLTLGTEEMRLNAADVNKDLDDFANYDTDALSGDSNSQANEGVPFQSEDIVSVDYAQFGKQIPLTSTQSQE